MDVNNILVHQNQFMAKQVADDMERFIELLEVAKIHKLRSERQARNARDWLTSDEPEATSFLGNLTTKMMEASTVIGDERYRLAAAKMGVDFDSIHQLAI